MILDPDRTSRQHGWIYGCFEPVKLLSDSADNSILESFSEPTSNESPGNVPKAFALRPSFGDVFSLSDSTNNLINALNLMSEFRENNKDHLVMKYLHHQDNELFDQIEVTAV